MPNSQFDWQKNSQIACKFEIEIDYIHHVKELYKRLYLWFLDEGFEGFHGDDNPEMVYWQKTNPSGLLEHNIWWRVWKYPGAQSHQSKFFKWFIKLNYRTIAVSSQEIMHKGKKWKINKANTILTFEGWLVYENLGKWDSGLLKGIKNRYKEWIYKDKIQLFEGQLVGKVIDLQNSIKAFLEIRMDKEQPASVYPPSSLP